MFRVSCVNEKNPKLPALSATTHVAQAVVSPRVVLGDARTKLLHQEGYVMWLRCFL